uniref:Uncharacterized protein n=1 Tax=Anguilla anguilla TaxID=7936 RepID=A0A0E9V2A2_ANGAN
MKEKRTEAPERRKLGFRSGRTQRRLTPCHRTK